MSQPDGMVTLTEGKFPKELIDEAYVRKIVREELLAILNNTERLRESEPIYEYFNGVASNIVGSKELPCAVQCNTMLDNLITSTKGVDES